MTTLTICLGVAVALLLIFPATSADGPSLNPAPLATRRSQYPPPYLPPYPYPELAPYPQPYPEPDPYPQPYPEPNPYPQPYPEPDPYPQPYSPPYPPPYPYPEPDPYPQPYPYPYPQRQRCFSVYGSGSNGFCRPRSQCSEELEPHTPVCPSRHVCCLKP